MTIGVREVIPEAYRSVTVALLCRYLNPAYDEARFDWLYRRNPAGPGRLWLAFDSTNGVVGTAAAFPRVLCVNGTTVLGWVLGDFCVAESYRTLGPALALQRASLEALGAQPDSWCYDFPGGPMMPVYKRLRVGSVRSMRRFVKLLRVGPVLARYLGAPRLANRIGAAVDLVLAYRDRPPRSPISVVTSLLDARCGDDFSALAAKVGGRYGFCLLRSAAHLAWRYQDNPIRRYEILTARLGGELAGYAVFSEDTSEATLVDLFGFPDPEVLGPLVQGVADLARERGCATLTVGLLDSHPWGELLQRLGFSRRETSPIVLLPPSTSTLGWGQSDQEALFLTQGDSDS